MLRLVEPYIAYGYDFFFIVGWICLWSLLVNPTWSQYVNWSTNADMAKSISNAFLLQTMLLSKKPLESLIFFASRILSTKSSLVDLTSNRYTPTDFFFCCVIYRSSRPPTFCGRSSSLTPQVDGEHGNSSIMYRVVTLVTEKGISTSSFDRWTRDSAVYTGYAIHILNLTFSLNINKSGIRIAESGHEEAFHIEIDCGSIT